MSDGDGGRARKGPEPFLDSGPSKSYGNYLACLATLATLVTLATLATLATLLTRVAAFASDFFAPEPAGAFGEIFFSATIRFTSFAFQGPMASFTTYESSRQPSPHVCVAHHRS
jgi:hypothetical protein